MDGADFRVPESGPKFYSFKYKKSGFRYEIGLSILTGNIVWINGPYECGLWPDISIFHNSLISHLEVGEQVESDDGYIGEAPGCIKCLKSFSNPEETLFMQQRVRNRQETVNKRMKNWGVLKQVYRHRFTGHGDLFTVIAVITQITIENGEPLFQCGYRDPPYEDKDENEDWESGSEYQSDVDDVSDSDLSYDSE